MKNKIVLLGIVTLFAMFAMTASVEAAQPPNTVWFEPENSSAEYCNTTDVDILLNATEGVMGFDIWIEYDPGCANITKAAPGDFPSVFLVKYVEGAIHMIGSTSDLKDVTGTHLKLATITIHCENDGYCTTLLDLNESCEIGNQINERLEAAWYDGTFSCRDTEKPDLVITDKYETLVNGSLMVTYTVANIGAGDADASNTTISVDGMVVEDQVPGLKAGKNYTSTVGTIECPCDTNVTVLVCADCDNDVNETDEENNCLENVFECPLCEPGIEVNKTVWDPVNEEWIDKIDGAEIGDIYKFRCEVQNTGNVNLTDIRFWDIASCSLEFAGNMTVCNMPVNETLIPPYPFKPKRLHPVNLTWDPYAPISNEFVELCPDQDKKYHLSSWEDTNGDGKLSYCDQIDMEGEKVVDQYQIQSNAWDELQNIPLYDYQSFVPTVSTLDAVRVALWGNSGNVTVTIYDSTMIPIGTSTLQLGKLGDPNTPEWVQFHFTPPVGLTLGQTHYIALTTDGDYYWFHIDADKYPFGHEWRDNTPYKEMDWTFITEYYGKTWYHVELLPYTLTLTNLETEDITYFDSELDYQEIDLSEPGGTQWKEVCCCKDSYELVNWTDNGNGILGFCDYIILRNKRTNEIAEYHVEEVAIDLVVSREWRIDEYYPQGFGFVLTPKSLNITYPPTPYPPANNTIVIKADARVVGCGKDSNLLWAKGKYESGWISNSDDAWVNVPGEPDLVINKSVTFVDGMFIVNYTVTNIGCGLAGNSTTCKLVDGELMESQPCPALKSGESYSSSFDPEECPCGETLNVTVCADNDDVVEESNETNNCEVNIVECPSAPSIDVEKTVWNQVTEEWVDELTTLLGETVTFNSTIHNDGECCNLTNLTITDTLSDSFEYVGHYPNITAEVIKNPDGSTTLIWEIPGPLVPCESLTFLINATLIKTGVDTNVQNATAWCGETMVADEDTATVHSVIPEGGIGVSVTPRFNTVNSSVNLSIKIVNTENFDDVFVVSLTNESLPPDWRADLSWFNWTSTEVAIPAGGEVLIPLRADVPTGVPAGKKAFRVVVESTLWTPTVFDTGILEIL